MQPHFNGISSLWLVLIVIGQNVNGQPPPPQQTGPQVSRCRADLQRIDVHLLAQAPSPFSVQLRWAGPAGTYRVTGAFSSVDVPVEAALATLDGPLNIPTAGGATTPVARSDSAAGSYEYARPRYAVVPDTDYSFSVQMSLPNGHLACGEARVKTPPVEAIAALQSAYLEPDDVRLGFVLPAFAQELHIYRDNFTDGRSQPHREQVYFERLANPSTTPLTFGLKEGRGGTRDGRKRIDHPGFPPVPKATTRPGAYEFTVEAVWLDAAGRPGNRTSTRILVDGPQPLSGWADLHTHPMSNLAFGGKVFHGGVDVGSLLPAVQMLNEPNDPTCRFDARAASMEEALSNDAPTQGDTAQSTCGSGLRSTILGFVGKVPMAGFTQVAHHRMGAPGFEDWPKWDDMLHQKMWFEWIRQARDGGLRVMVALSHNNRTLGDLVGDGGGPGLPDPPNSPGRGYTDARVKPNSGYTDDVHSSDLQIQEMKAFVGRHSNFMQVALDAADVYSIVQSGRLAVVLGVEIDNIGNFHQPPPLGPAGPITPALIAAEIQRLYDQGVRYIFPIHLVDNTFGGTGIYNHEFNWANYRESIPPSRLQIPLNPNTIRAPGEGGRFWDVECGSTPPYLDDQVGFRLGLPSEDEAIWGFETSIRQTRLGISPTVHTPPAPPDCITAGGSFLGHRNKLGLTGLGAIAVKEMMKRGMIVDIDHMSHRAAEEALAIAEGVPGGGYPVVSGHTGIRDSRTNFDAENSRTPVQLGRIACLMGMFGLGTSGADAYDWATQYAQAAQAMRSQTGCPDTTGSVSLGTDTNSIVPSARPTRGPGKLPGAMERTGGDLFSLPSAPGKWPWEYHADGVAHYGLYADFIKDVRTYPSKLGAMNNGQELVDNYLYRNADYFWRMWLRIEAQKTNVR